MHALDPVLLQKAREGDMGARDALFAANTGLIWACVRRYLGLLEKDDLYQLGSIGLLKALSRFDPSYGVAFSTFAVPHILGEIRRYLRDSTPLVVERRKKELAAAARKSAASALGVGKEQSLKETAETLGVPVDTLVEALDATAPLVYLDESPDRDRAAQDFDHTRMEVDEAISRLPPRLGTIITQRFIEGRTQSEIARRMGVSQAHISRLEKAAVAALRGYMEGDRETLT